MKIATIEKINEKFSNVHFDIENPLVALLFFSPVIILGAVEILAAIFGGKRT